MMKHIAPRRPLHPAIAAAASLALGPLPVHAVNATWNGGAGNWGAAANWTPATVPIGDSFDVFIDGGKPAASAVTVDIGPPINSLRLDANDAIIIPEGQGLALAAGGTINGTISLLATTPLGTRFAVQTTQTLSGSGQILFGGSTTANAITGAGALTIANTLTVRAASNGGSISVASVTNRGSIIVDSPGHTLTISSANFLNTGTLRADTGLLSVSSPSWTNMGLMSVQSTAAALTVSSGNFRNQGTARVSAGILNITSNAWTNTGRLEVTGGTLNLGGNVRTADLGTISRTGGQIDVTGTLNNTAATLTLSATTGPFNLRGTIQGGTVTSSLPAALIAPAGASGTLRQVNLNANLSVSNGANVNIANGLTMAGGRQIMLEAAGNPTSLTFNGAQTLGGSGIVQFAGNGAGNRITGTGPLTVGPDITILSRSNSGEISINSFVNRGVIWATNGTTLTISSSNFTNDGVLRASGRGIIDTTAGLSADGDGAVSVETGGRLFTPFLRRPISFATPPANPPDYPGLRIKAKPQGGQTSIIGDFPTNASGAPLVYIAVANNDLIVDYPTSGPSLLSKVRNAINSAYNNGAWGHPGISTFPTTNMALGYIESSQLLGPTGGTFSGVPADATAVLVRFTLAGDANVDGAVTFPDLVAVAQNYGATLTNADPNWWIKGDFDYNGLVGFPDLVKLAQNYNQSLPTAPIPGAPEGFDNDLARAFATVPEPSTAGLLIMAAFGLVTPSRRRPHTAIPQPPSPQSREPP